MTPSDSRVRVFVPPFALLLLVGMFSEGSGAPEDGESPPGDFAPATPAEAKQSADETKSEKWDVDAPPGPSKEIAIDTDEGTWLNVDVSPNGARIAFDLLGDIYTVNVAGSTERLTSGVAWDMQPRFSPDGSLIAFTSDRGGGDNIWVMKSDGSEPRAITNESFRLLNSPAWTPDGDYILARKHFTSRRSLGAGEIWLYHRSGGGSGIQLVARPNDQKDLGEPAASPDGRYVYYSRDVTPGSTFEYNKDSNGEIYAILRLDRETGEIERVTGGPGGAIRPTPSPDGKSLAFIRRVRFRSVLFVRDLASGAERAVFDDLDRDMQETWAIHGVYAQMAWTPDSSSIVLWAGGKIRRIDIASGEATTIPFRVRDTRTVAETLRVPIEVSPDEFDVKLIRWASTGGDGTSIVFQALGRVYVRDLGDGTTRPLTTADEHFEHAPTASRDGKSVVFATWDDEELGSIRLAPVAGGEAMVLVDARGHYTDPVLSPDGGTVVYRKMTGGGLLNPLWSIEPGVYALRIGEHSEDATPVRLVTSGRRPHFGAASDRVYFTGSSGGKAALKSIRLDRTEERTHLTSENGTEFRVSPDGRWVAFIERFNVYVLPFISTGKPLAVGPKTKSIPVARVSHDAGVYVHWSADSQMLHWTLGGKFYSQPLAHAFAFLEGAPDPLPGAQKESVEIGFRQPAYRPEGIVALVGARVITMRGDEVIADGAVVFERDRITAIGPRGEVAIPDGARVVDCAGKTILPGLVDVHAHGAQASSGIVPEQNYISYSELSFGVTTIHDPSNNTEAIFAASELAKAGRIVSPRVFSTGTILYGAAGSFKAEVDSLDDARFHLRRMQAVGAFTVKSYNQPRRDQRQQVMTAARELGMMVVPEGGSLFQHNMTMVVDGHTGVEHCLPVAKVYSDVVQLWSQTKTGYTPTLGVAYGGISGERYWYDTTDVWKNERLLQFVPRRRVDPLARRRTKAPLEEYNHIDAAKICKQFVDAGIGVQLGAHGQREGLAAHWELWMFAQGGMTPHEALRSATLSGAEYLGLDGDIGSIAPGKLADLIVVDGNPLDNIRDSEKIFYTIVGGRVYEARTMDEIGPNGRKRKPFYFETGADSSPSFGVESACGCARSTQSH